MTAPNIEQMTASALTQAQIEVICPYPIQYITGLEIESKIGEHSRITATGILHEEEGANFLGSSNLNDQIAVYDVSGTEETRLFSGIITSVVVRHDNGLYYVEIEGMSYTYIMDITLKSRSFQNIRATYHDVVNEVIKDYDNKAFIQIPQDRPVGNMIVQYKETDWDFLKRLATHFNTVLIADAIGDYPRFWMGIHNTSRQLEDILEYTTNKDIERFRYVAGHGLIVIEWDFIKHGFWSNTRLSLGDSVIFFDTPYVVEYIKVGFANGLFRYFYTIRRERGLLQPLRRNEQLHGVSLLGSIIDRTGSNVRIHLKIDESQAVDTAKWIPFASEGNNVLYCMPEIGEKVSLYFSNANEAEAIAINILRSNGGSCSTMTDPNERCISIPSGQECRLGSNDLDISNNDSNINLSDSRGIISNSICNISIRGNCVIFEAEGNIYCETYEGDDSEGIGELVITIAEIQLFLDAFEEFINLIATRIRLLGILRTAMRSLNELIEVESKPKVPWWARALKVLAIVVISVALIKLVPVLIKAKAVKKIAYAAIVYGAYKATVSAVRGDTWDKVLAKWVEGVITGALFKILKVKKIPALIGVNLLTTGVGRLARYGTLHITGIFTGREVNVDLTGLAVDIFFDITLPLIPLNRLGFNGTWVDLMNDWGTDVEFLTNILGVDDVWGVLAEFIPGRAPDVINWGINGIIDLFTPD